MGKRGGRAKPKKARSSPGGPVHPFAMWRALPFALLASLIGWAFLAGPLRNTPLAALDQSLADNAMRLGADHRREAGPALFVVDYDQAEWIARGQPAEMPAEDLVTALVFARSSGASLVFLDLALGARSARGTASRLDPSVTGELSRWSADDSAPLLLIADGSGSVWAADGPVGEAIARLGNVALASAVIRLGENGEARSLEAWSCSSGGGTPVASPLPFLAAVRAGGSAVAAKRVVAEALATACERSESRLVLGSESFRKTEPIFFHLGGGISAVSTRSGEPALARRSFGTVREAVKAGPSSRQCPGRTVYMTDSCDSILVIGATHSGASDRFATPLSPLAADRGEDPMMPGPIVVGNAMRGYSVFGLAGAPGIFGSAVLLCVSLLAIFLLFYAWQIPYVRVAAAGKSGTLRGRSIAGLSWIFGPVVAKFAATTLWSIALLLWYYFDLKWVFGPGLIVASFIPALTFSVMEVQQLESGEPDRT
jgi:hypothetical protein